MASSGYTAISFTAGEQPTTAKWNLLGANDASFNNGNGFNDGIIVSRHFSNTQVPSIAMNLTKTTDANGWTKYDFGTFQQYYKTGSTSVSLTANQFTAYTISTNLPVGITSVATNHVTGAVRGVDLALQASFHPGTTDTTIVANVLNAYSGAVNSTLFWTVCITTP